MISVYVLKIGSKIRTTTDVHSSINKPCVVSETDANTRLELREINLTWTQILFSPSHFFLPRFLGFT